MILLHILCKIDIFNTIFNYFMVVVAFMFAQWIFFNRHKRTDEKDLL